MILSSLVIAGALGVGSVGASLKAYREQKRKKEYPWTVAAERMAKRELLKGRPNRRFGGEMRGRIRQNVKRVQVMTIAMTQEIIAPFVGDSRQQQLQELAVGSEVEISEKEKKARQNVRANSVMLGLAIGGALIHPALYMPCGLLMEYDYVSSRLPLAYQALIKERRLNIHVLYTFFVTGSTDNSVSSFPPRQGCGMSL